MKGLETTTERIQCILDFAAKVSARPYVDLGETYDPEAKRRFVRYVMRGEECGQAARDFRAKTLLRFDV